MLCSEFDGVVIVWIIPIEGHYHKQPTQGSSIIIWSFINVLLVLVMRNAQWRQPQCVILTTISKLFWVLYQLRRYAAPSKVKHSIHGKPTKKIQMRPVQSRPAHAKVGAMLCDVSMDSPIIAQVTCHVRICRTHQVVSVVVFTVGGIGENLKDGMESDLFWTKLPEFFDRCRNGQWRRNGPAKF